jgi:hypothetical protein
MKPKPERSIVLRGLPFGFPKGYRAILSRHTTLKNALVWGLLSGLSSAILPDGERKGRLWVEAYDRPATLVVDNR